MYDRHGGCAIAEGLIEEGQSIFTTTDVLTQLQMTTTQSGTQDDGWGTRDDFLCRLKWVCVSPR